ncbi:amidase [Microbacteriaceae bacterium SG_E_30_P1]|uniref:Amidase n=1 Tax=Antiquaquibacter oligotrophicus TaxID=2880260 RepID=A0ABT6KK26_9MICO|nr:amidase family protein [Antiquaquibacter oligotrophicus]MDH6180184.1 amidase [Antiquaquibacter oligotrophicus]UDF14065.1 amidase [Antiquaquibacter oligotrophicus]
MSEPARSKPWRRRIGAIITAGAIGGALIVAPTLATAVPSDALSTIDLATAGVPEVRAGLDAKQFTSVQLVTGYLERIEALSIGGPALNSVRSINPRVYEEAAALDAELAAGNLRGPLHGVPILVKDNIDVAGMPTTAGALSLANSYPASDAPLVTELRAAGAIILGKTNLSEFANYLTSGMPSGYSSLGGQVLNPYDASQTPSGSSSGSGSAGATGLATLTVGTETSGSILSPAKANSLAAVKPTVGLVSRTGVIPISSSQDTAGPMVKTVYDAAALLTAMSAIDPEDPATAANPLADTDFTAGLSTSALQGVRLGYIANTDPLYTASLDVLAAQGATLVPVTVGGTSAPGILTAEFKRDMNAYLDRLPADAPIQSFDEIREYNLAHPEAIKFGQRYFDEGILVNLDDPAQLATYEANRDQGITETRAAIDSVLEANDIVAIVSNTATTGTGARAGYPTVVVPNGYTPGNLRPGGTAFLGTAWSEQTLLALAYDYEQASMMWQSPEVTNPSLFRCAETSAVDEWKDAACLTIPAAPGTEPEEPEEPEEPGTEEPGTPAPVDPSALTPETKNLEISNVTRASLTAKVPTAGEGDDVTFYVYSEPQLLGTEAMPSSLAVTLSLPSGLEGAHSLVALDESGALLGWGEFTVPPVAAVTPPTRPDADLASTGSGIQWGVPIGASILLLAGAATVIAVRRSRASAMEAGQHD